MCYKQHVFLLVFSVTDKRKIWTIQVFPKDIEEEKRRVFYSQSPQPKCPRRKNAGTSTRQM